MPASKGFQICLFTFSPIKQITSAEVDGCQESKLEGLCVSALLSPANIQATKTVLQAEAPIGGIVSYYARGLAVGNNLDKVC